MQDTTCITALHCNPYRLPFAHNFTTAHGFMRVREGAIIELATAEGIIGVGEIAPLSSFGGGVLADALRLLPNVSAQLQGRTLHAALQWLASATLPSALCCGLEIALLDALGQCEQVPLCQLLANKGIQPRTSIAVNAVVGAPSIRDAVREARAAMQADFRCIKLKVGILPSLEQEIERIAAVRAALGSALHLRLDANEAWTFEQARKILLACAAYDIQYIEQPLPRQDLRAMQQLRQAVSVPIAADEAVHDLTSAQAVMKAQAADILIIKPQLCGGLRAAQRIMHEASERSLQCVITTTIESGISLIAALHLAAASPSITPECGLATSHLLVDDLIIEPIVVQQGMLAVPVGMGLGMTLDRVALKRYM